MREILFRGKTEDGRWVEGFYVNCASVYEPKNRITEIMDIGADRICRGGYSPFDTYQVLPETVGQFTGLFDEDGIAIFEGDILLYRDQLNKNLFTKEPYVVKYSTILAAFTVENNVDGKWDYITPHEYKIIGNIHDNPELLKEA